ncbi:MAG TPA: tautomerase family protein [Burkholderiales bacterium]|nr:tautomerase family protein [Burkholderiales bacterium]
MPNATIEVRRDCTEQQGRSLIDAVHSAMMEALGIPAWDRTLRLIRHDAADFAAPPQASENFTLIEIDLFAGRSLAAKKALYQAIVRNLGALGIAASDVKILLRESVPENWGVRGGVPASEIDLGFRIDV